MRSEWWAGGSEQAIGLYCWFSGGIAVTRGLLVGVFLVSHPSLSPAIGNAQGKQVSPAEQIAVLKVEYDRVPGGRAIASDAERLEYIGRVYRHHQAVGEKLVALAEAHPRDPVALDALTLAVWQVNTTPWPVDMVGEDAARPRAFAIIERDHIQSDKLGPLCQRVSYGFCREYEAFLRAVVAKNPNRQVQATARLSLAQFLCNRMYRVDLCKEMPELADEFVALYGKEYYAELKRQDRDAVEREIESRFETTAKELGDVRLAGGTVAELATVQLNHFRTLQVGKEAPEIEGIDQQGAKFKLSEHRGKAVLLDFWSYV